MPSRRRPAEKIAVIDLFAGPGGLGEGFTSLEVDGHHPFDIVLSAEKDPMAQRTLELRAFFRKFRGRCVPREYFKHLCGDLSREELFARYPTESSEAIEESRRFELGGRNRKVLEERLNSLKLDRDQTIVIGGPPCQAYSVVGRSRSSAKSGWSLETDDRSHLYKEYLHVLAHVQPAAFVMENVRGLLSARFGGASVFEMIRADLQDPQRAILRKKGGRRYRLIPLGSPAAASDSLWGESAPEDFLLRAEEFGVPQARHRVIVLGLSEDLAVDRLAASIRRVKVKATVESAISELPPLRSGLSEGNDSLESWRRHLGSALGSIWLKGCDDDVRRAVSNAVKALGSTELGRGAECLRSRAGGKSVYNHSTRGHMASDLHRYLFAASYATVHGYSPTLEEYPRALLPEHANVTDHGGKVMFNDRFRVQLGGAPSTTITSHISKDGHYYIHPDPVQCRSLTVREAARLQTFPDDYYFCGPRTAQYQQVGNAVPVRMAGQLARAIKSIGY